MRKKKRENGNDIIRNKLARVPMPASGWEARLISYILRHPQEKQGYLAAWLGMVTGMFDRRQFLGPALAATLLAVTYFVQPIGLYGSMAAEQEEAVLYLEEITNIAAYELDFDAWASSWVLEY